MSLSRNIARARKAKRLTAAEFARVMDVSRSTVHTWEHGGPGPGLDRLVEIAQKLDVSVAELIGEARAS